MNVSSMSTPARAWWLVVMPVLAGIGIFTILSWLGRWLPLGIGVLAVAVGVWAVRELRWARRMQAEIKADLVELDRLREGE